LNRCNLSDVFGVFLFENTQPADFNAELLEANLHGLEPLFNAHDRSLHVVESLAVSHASTLYTY